MGWRPSPLGLVCPLGSYQHAGLPHLLPNQRPWASPRPLFAVGLPHSSGPSSWLGTAALMQWPTKKIDNSCACFQTHSAHLSCPVLSCTVAYPSTRFPSFCLLFFVTRCTCTYRINHPPLHNRTRSVSDWPNRTSQSASSLSQKARPSAIVLVCLCAQSCTMILSEQVLLPMS